VLSTLACVSKHWYFSLLSLKTDTLGVISYTQQSQMYCAISTYNIICIIHKIHVNGISALLHLIPPSVRPISCLHQLSTLLFVSSDKQPSLAISFQLLQYRYFALRIKIDHFYIYVTHWWLFIINFYNSLLFPVIFSWLTMALGALSSFFTKAFWMFLSRRECLPQLSLRPAIKSLDSSWQRPKLLSK
jgi:hypothetical protein